MAVFKLKTDLPHTTQLEISRILAIPSGQRLASESAFITALGDYIYNNVIAYDSDGFILQASGITVPTGDSGFVKGATFIKTNASGNGLYLNTGDSTTSSWDLVDQASESNIVDGAVTENKLANNAVTSNKIASGAVTAGKLATTLDLTPNTISLSIKSGTAVNAVAATATLTGSDVFSDAETVTIGSTVYTMKTALSDPAVPFEVLIGATLADSLDNLKSAINASTGEGSTYATGTTAHPNVTATTNTNTTQVIEAKIKGTAGNSIATTETGANSSWGGSTMSGGVNGTIGAAREILVDSSYLYLNTSANTGIEATWKRISLGSVF